MLLAIFTLFFALTPHAFADGPPEPMEIFDGSDPIEYLPNVPAWKKCKPGTVVEPGTLNNNFKWTCINADEIDKHDSWTFGGDHYEIIENAGGPKPGRQCAYFSHGDVYRGATAPENCLVQKISWDFDPRFGSRCFYVGKDNTVTGFAPDRACIDLPYAKEMGELKRRLSMVKDAFSKMKEELDEMRPAVEAYVVLKSIKPNAPLITWGQSKKFVANGQTW